MTAINTLRSKTPWLLYSYPWMPYPRRLAIYLDEKCIPSSIVQIVHVSDSQIGNSVVTSQASKYPPLPTGSLPILAIASTDGEEPTYIHQSMVIINFLEEQCAAGGVLADIDTRSLATGKDGLERARLTELLTLSEELTVCWNPVRMFGTNAGTMRYPEGAREMFRWVHRLLNTVNALLGSPDHAARVDHIADNEVAVSIADIVLFQFLEFVDYCYGVDVTKGSGEKKADVYGHEVVETYPALAAFYQAFKKRKSAERDGEIGELASQAVLNRMRFWHDGVLEESR